jgi:putative ABC transport system substrate-binding protein
MRRREFITLIGGSVAWPLAAQSQQTGKVWKVGFIAGGSRPASIEGSAYSGFLQGMRDLDYAVDKNFEMEWRFAEGRYELFPDLAAELVRLKVDVIVLGSPSAVGPVHRVTSTIPIVMGYSTDPVGNGFVASLARPGANITGLASLTDDTTPKRIELLATAVANLSHIGVIENPASPSSRSVMAVAKEAGRNAGLIVTSVEAKTPQEIESAFIKLTKEGVGAVMFVPDAFFFAQRERIAELALKHQLPCIFTQREYVAAGGLMSYGENLRDFYRRAATYVDKIFRGAKPADLPIQQPTKFELAINLKTAKATGLTLPPSLLAQADELID